MTDSASAPSPDLTILETRVYRGANVWSYDKSIHLVVDLGSLEDFPSNTLPGFTDNLVELLPGTGMDMPLYWVHGADLSSGFVRAPG